MVELSSQGSKQQATVTRRINNDITYYSYSQHATIDQKPLNSCPENQQNQLVRYCIPYFSVFASAGRLLSVDMALCFRLGFCYNNSKIVSAPT